MKYLDVKLCFKYHKHQTRVVPCSVFYMAVFLSVYFYASVLYSCAVLITSVQCCVVMKCAVIYVWHCVALTLLPTALQCTLVFNVTIVENVLGAVSCSCAVGSPPGIISYCRHKEVAENCRSLNTALHYTEVQFSALNCSLNTAVH